MKAMRLAVFAFACLISTATVASEAPGHVSGADELLWVPTLEQAMDMAAATERPMFLMGYSLVDEKCTYTKFGPEFCASVF